MKKIDRIINLVSWMTIIALLMLVVVRNCTGVTLPEPLMRWLIPIMTAAAIGYLTNWIAIWLLFKPYHKHCGFIQGVIPRNKEKLGHELAEIIPEYLLKPDELADQLGTLVRDYLQNPSLLDDIRTKVNIFLKRYSANIAEFLIPYIENAIKKAIAEHLTPEKLSRIYDDVVVKYLGNHANRQMLADAIVNELKNQAPELTGAIRDIVRTGASDYVKEEYPRLSSWLNADTFAVKLVDWLNWERIARQIETKLGAVETQNIVAKELTALTVKIQIWLRTPEATEKLTDFLSENRTKAEAFVKEYLTENIPVMVDSWLRTDEFWNAVEQKLLPLVQSFILNRLKREKDTIIQKFDIPGKIQKSVEEMDVAKLHAMINRASGEHLIAIQLLGYGLGAIAGLLLIFVE